MTADRIVVAVAAGQADDRDVRMAGQEPDQLAAGVARGADDPDPDPPRTASRIGAPFGTREEPGRAVRRDRRGRLESRAHGRVRPSREAGSGGSPGSDGPPSWVYDYTRS